MKGDPLGCPKGNCAEPKAASAAHNNRSQITGADTRTRMDPSWLQEDNRKKYIYTGKDPDKVHNNQMDPCSTCSQYEEEYMRYATYGYEHTKEVDYCEITTTRGKC